MNARARTNPVAILLVVTAMFHVGCTMPGKSFTGPLPAVTPDQRSLADELCKDVTKLAGDIGHRDTDHPKGLEAAAAYIEAELKKAGLAPQRHGYDCRGQRVFNIDAEIKGTGDEVIVVGAHYD